MLTKRDLNSSLDATLVESRTTNVAIQANDLSVVDITTSWWRLTVPHNLIGYGYCQSICTKRSHHYNQRPELVRLEIVGQVYEELHGQEVLVEIPPDNWDICWRQMRFLSRRKCQIYLRIGVVL